MHECFTWQSIHACMKLTVIEALQQFIAAQLHGVNTVTHWRSAMPLKRETSGFECASSSIPFRVCPFQVHQKLTAQPQPYYVLLRSHGTYILFAIPVQSLRFQIRRSQPASLHCEVPD